MTLDNGVVVHLGIPLHNPADCDHGDVIVGILNSRTFVNIFFSGIFVT